MRKLVVLIFAIDASFVPPVTKRLPLGGEKDQVDPICKLKYELFNYDPNPSSKSLVVASDKKFRAQVLTEDLFRFEYSETGDFENRPTLTFLNRNLTDVPKFSHFEQDGKLVILTSNFNISYVVGSGLETGEDLRVTSLNPERKYNGDSSFVWEYGMNSSTDSGNLFGTYRTLDGTDNPSLDCKLNKKDHCVYGLISRNGWATVEDHDSPILDCNDWWADDQLNFYKSKDKIDIYLFAHEMNYKKALFDYQLVAGKIPIHPRAAHGIWWTRWYNMLDIDVYDQINEHLIHSLPLDVLILDMNWHRKNHWTGYTFDQNLYPDYARFLADIKASGLDIGANLHDAQGIMNFETLYPEAVEAINYSPDVKDVDPVINFTISNRTQTLGALEDVMLKDLEDKGMDFWWIDWQQGEDNHGVPGGKFNPTIWTDKMRCTNSKRQDIESGNPKGVTKRGMVLARFGGLGNHRYQVGFSGDVKHLSWDDLAYQPYFSSTASNVGFGFWSHDIEGPSSDHEMYTRWIQWGAYSGIMRSHDRGMSSGACKDPFPTDDLNTCSIVQPWKVPPKFFGAIRAALVSRLELTPYIYTQTAIAHKTGVSLIRPIYYEHPKLDDAYKVPEQYYFGENMMMRPIVEKSDNSTLVRNVTIWLPPGCWYEESTEIINIGDDGLYVNRTYDIEEIPHFVKCGSVIPFIPVGTNAVGKARQDYSQLDFIIYHDPYTSGTSVSSGVVYQDDGESTAYLNGEFSEVFISAISKNPSYDKNIHIQAFHKGSYGIGKMQGYSIVIPNVSPSFQIHTDDMPPYTHAYNSYSLSLVINILPTKVNEGILFDFTLDLEHPIGEMAKTLSPLPKLMRRARLSKLNTDETQQTPGTHQVDNAYLSHFAGLPSKLRSCKESNKKLDCTTWWTYANTALDLFKMAYTETVNMKIPSQDRYDYSVGLLQDLLP